MVTKMEKWNALSRRLFMTSRLKITSLVMALRLNDPVMQEFYMVAGFLLLLFLIGNVA